MHEHNDQVNQRERSETMNHHLTRRTLVGGLAAGATALAVRTSGVEGQSTDPGEQLLRFVDAVYGNADPATIEQIVDEVIAENWTPEDDRDQPGREALKERLLAGNEVFLILWRDWTTTVDEIFATDSRAAARVTIAGTGHDDSQSTLSLIVIAHAADGKLTRAFTGTGTLETSAEATPTA
jgi:SnoaL-like domain